MIKKKILIVSRSFYPENSPRSHRTTELVKEFSRQGHDVTLLTVKNDSVHPSFEKKYGISIKDIGKLRFPKIDIRTFSGLNRLLRRAARRGLDLFLEYPDIELMYKVNKALKHESGYDLMISIAVPYPVHWGVAKARRENHQIAKIWVADCGDPYVGLENDSFKVPFYFSYVEKWFCRKADYITIPFEGARSAYFPEFESKIRVIPQGLSFPDIERKGSSQNGLTTFAYFGNIESYLHYAVPFLQKLNRIEDNFRFIVYTQRRGIFEQNLTESTLKKCSIRDYIERDLLLQELNGVDFLVHFPYQKGTQKSLKLIDYLFLKKPILEYCADESSDNTLQEFLQKEFSNQRGVEDYSKYDIKRVCRQFLELTEESTVDTHFVVTG